MFHATVLQSRHPGAIRFTVPSDGRGFLQPRGDIRESIVPRGFRALPANVREAVNTFFHREELENRSKDSVDDDQEMSTDTKAAVTVRKLRVSDPVAMAMAPRT